MYSKKAGLFHTIKTGPSIPGEVYCIVEIPKGSTNKYEYHKESGAFFLDRVLSESIFYPTEYGIIPQTWNKADSDPLDIMVICSFPTFAGCIISARPIAILRLTDTGEEDNKIIAVAADDPHFADVKDLGDLPAHTKKELENFWQNYAELEPRKKIKITGWGGRGEAEKEIKEATENYKKKFGTKG